MLFAANWLAKDHNNKTVDVTANKRFTLSDQTRKVVGDLKKPVNIYYFDKSDSYERARDMLDRYKNLSSQIKVNYVDPDKKPDVARVEGMHNFGDIIVDNGVKKETAKALTEEELTGAIIRDLKSGARTACFVRGSGEHQLDDTSREGWSDPQGRSRKEQRDEDPDDFADREAGGAEGVQHRCRRRTWGVITCNRQSTR